MMVALALATLLQAGQGISHTPLGKSATMEAARVEFAPGATAASRGEIFDVVIIPIDEGMSIDVDGQLPTWTSGRPLLVSRGAPHTLANRTTHRVRFFEIRTIGDNLAGNNRALSTEEATIVASVAGKYVRATVWRVEPGGHVEWPGDMDAIVVHVVRGAPAPSGGVIVNPHEERANAEDVFVRVCREAPSR